MWVIAIITIIGATSAEPKPQYDFGGGIYTSIEQCEGALIHRQTDEVRLTQNSLGRFVLYGQARGYIWTEGCLQLPK